MSMTQDIVSFDPARPSVEVSRVRVDAGAVDAAVHAARAASSELTAITRAPSAANSGSSAWNEARWPGQRRQCRPR